VLNTRGRARPPMAPALRRRLTEEFAPDIARLQTLLDRDLGAWLAPGGDRRVGPEPERGVASDGRTG
jgi:hypothetical protein